MGISAKYYIINFSIGVMMELYTNRMDIGPTGRTMQDGSSGYSLEFDMWSNQSQNSACDLTNGERNPEYNHDC